MTVVISSPINYLVLIGEIDVLAQLYGKVLIPDAVLAELRESGSPPAVAAWSLVLPAWIEVVLTPAIGDNMAALDPGELAAIALACSLRGDTLL